MEKVKIIKRNFLGVELTTITGPADEVKRCHWEPAIEEAVRQADEAERERKRKHIEQGLKELLMICAPGTDFVIDILGEKKHFAIKEVE